MFSTSSDCGCLMEVITLRGFNLYRLWKFRGTVTFLGGGAQGGLYPEKPLLFHAL